MEQQYTVLMLNSEGTKLSYTLTTNEKGLLKSLEQNCLWYLHPETGRLIEWEQPHRLIHVRREDGPLVLAGELESEARNQDSEAAMKPGIPRGDVNHWGVVLADLEQLIVERKREMPEGSYTTHLFSKGEDKIRKKTGEEAVELLLAKEPQEVSSEFADFLYHGLVLLVQLGIPFDRVIEELKKR